MGSYQQPAKPQRNKPKEEKTAWKVGVTVGMPSHILDSMQDLFEASRGANVIWVACGCLVRTPLKIRPTAASRYHTITLIVKVATPHILLDSYKGLAKGVMDLMAHPHYSVPQFQCVDFWPQTLLFISLKGSPSFFMSLLQSAPLGQQNGEGRKGKECRGGARDKKKQQKTGTLILKCT